MRALQSTGRDEGDRTWVGVDGVGVVSFERFCFYSSRLLALLGKDVRLESRLLSLLTVHFLSLRGP